MTAGVRALGPAPTTYRDRLAREGIKVGIEDARAVALSAILGQGDLTPRDFVVLVG